MSQILRLQGLRGSTIYHNDDGYYYYCNSSDSTRLYLRCVRKNVCSGRATMPSHVEGQLADNFRHTTPHDHEPDFSYIPTLQLRQRILKRCRKNAGEFSNIYNDEYSR